MVIKKEARLAQSLELLAHGNKPAPEERLSGLCFHNFTAILPSDFQNLIDVLLGRFFIYLLLKKEKIEFHMDE